MRESGQDATIAARPRRTRAEDGDGPATAASAAGRTGRPPPRHPR